MIRCFGSGIGQEPDVYLFILEAGVGQVPDAVDFVFLCWRRAGARCGQLVVMIVAVV